MSDDIRFEQHLGEALGDIAPARAPDRLRLDFNTAFDRVQPRSRWLALIKEPPMRISSRVAVGSPALRLASILAVTLLLVALVAGAGVAGASLLPGPTAVPGLRHNGLIAFDSADGNIYVAGPDGSDPRVLIDRKTPVRGPSWSPDGTRLAYYEVVGVGSYRGTDGMITNTDRALIHVMDADGSGDVELTAGVPVMALHGYSDSGSGSGLAWSADSSTIATSVVRQEPGRLEGYPSILAMPSDGTPGKLLPIGLDAVDPVWSPTGDRLAFRGGRRGADETTGVWTSGADGSDPRRVAAGPMPDYRLGSFAFSSPQWSPDGSQLAYETWSETADGGDDLGIWVVAANGSDPHRLVDDPAWQEFFPGWSPDGRSVAYQRYPSHVDQWSGNEILTVGPVGTEPTLLRTPPSGTDGNGPLRWAPDGGAILAVSGSDNRGGNESRLTIVSTDPAVEPTVVADPGGMVRPIGWDGWVGVSWQPIE